MQQRSTAHRCAALHAPKAPCPMLSTSTHEARDARDARARISHVVPVLSLLRHSLAVRTLRFRVVTSHRYTNAAPRAAGPKCSEWPCTAETLRAILHPSCPMPLRYLPPPLPRASIRGMYTGPGLRHVGLQMSLHVVSGARERAGRVSTVRSPASSRTCECIASCAHGLTFRPNRGHSLARGPRRRICQTRANPSRRDEARRPREAACIPAAAAVTPHCGLREREPPTPKLLQPSPRFCVIAGSS